MEGCGGLFRAYPAEAFYGFEIAIRTYYMVLCPAFFLKFDKAVPGGRKLPPGTAAHMGKPYLSYPFGFCLWKRQESAHISSRVFSAVQPSSRLALAGSA